MFTGIVAGRGRVLAVEPAEGAARRIVVDVRPLGRRLVRGDSVAVAGVCLTVARPVRGGRAAFDVIGETVRRTTLGDLEPGDEVNLEGSLRLGDALGGHQVQGHVDGVGTVTRVERRPDETWLALRAPAAVRRTLVPKGWIAVDGVSLTVAGLTPRGLFVALIPTTLELTTLGAARAGTRVNLEGDPLGKHVTQWLEARESARKGARRGGSIRSR